MKKSTLLLVLGAALVIGMIVTVFYPLVGLGTMTALGFGLVGTRFSDNFKANSFDAQGGGINSTGATPIPYAAIIVLPTPVKLALRHYIDFATLTGALTVNATSVLNFQEGDEIILRFQCDGTARTITWGTNFRAAVAGTFALTVSGIGVVKCTFMDAKLHIYSQTTGAL